MEALTQKQKAVFDEFNKYEKARPDYIAKEMGFSESAYIYGAIKALRKKGYLKRISGGKYIYYGPMKKAK